MQVQLTDVILNFEAKDREIRTKYTVPVKITPYNGSK